MAKLTKAERSRIMKKAWREREPIGICAYCGEPVWIGGIRREGKLYHRTHYAAKRLGIPPEVFNPFRPRRRRYTGPLLPKRENPEAYAYGPTGFRPPASWWAMMMARARAGYKKAAGMTEKAYRERLSRIVGGIWSRFSDRTRREILRKYEPGANPWLPGDLIRRGYVFHQGGFTSLSAARAEVKRLVKSGVDAVVHSYPGIHSADPRYKFAGPKGMMHEVWVRGTNPGRLPNPIIGTCPVHGYRIAIPPGAKSVRCLGGHTLNVPKAG